MVAGPGLAGDREEGVALLEGVCDEAVHGGNGEILDVVAEDKGVLIGVDPIHHVLVQNLAARGVARVAAGDVPVDIDVSFLF